SHYRESSKVLVRISDPYDVFIAIVHGIPPFCHARKGALIVLFPGVSAPYINLQGEFQRRAAFRHPARYMYQSWEWARRMKSYQIKTAISAFSRRWKQTLWGVNGQILYPPVDTKFCPQEKQK